MMLEAWTPKRILWSLRKMQLPISSNHLVLDVGSGNNPHPAADVLLEKYFDNRHRLAPLVADRPMVLADACKMPFRDKAFDFIIAFHVLEHMTDPARFLRELQRVGKAGYIEVPNALFERLVPYDIHLLEIMEVDNSLVINRKTSARPDRFLNNLNLVSRSRKWRKMFYGNPDLFHVRHLWKDIIRYEILNPETALDWFVEPETDVTGVMEPAVVTNSVRSFGLVMLRKWYRLRKRRTVNLLALVVCPECHNELLRQDDSLCCSNCKIHYPMSPVIDFNRGASRPT